MSDNLHEAVCRGNDLQVYIARTGAMLADARHWLNVKRESETMKVIEKIMKAGKLSAGVQNALIDSSCKEEQYLVDKTERLNRTCTHQLEWCRTVVSKGKAEMQALNAGKEFR